MRKGPSTNLGLAILGLLHQAPMSGYDLRKVFAETALGNFSSSPGAIYPALGRLERQDLVEGEEDRAKSLRPKKLYRPTAKGREVFREWLSREIETEDVRRNLDELMLRFAFYWALDSSVATRRFLRHLARELDNYIEELEEQKKLFPEEAPLHSRLALAAGIAQHRASARWAREAIGQFGEVES